MNTDDYHPKEGSPAQSLDSSQVREEPTRYPVAGTVLLVGYHRDLLGMCRELLVEQGLRVIVANSLGGALAGALNHRPAVILSVNMLYYREVLSRLIFRISTTPNARRVPLIVWTAMPSKPHDIASWVPGFIPGYDSHLIKPCSFGDILRQVREAMRSSPG